MSVANFDLKMKIGIIPPNTMIDTYIQIGSMYILL